jgi:ComF family protein
MRSIASLFAEILLGALAPPRCAACNVRVSAMAAFCAPCALTAEAAPAGAGAAFLYAGAVADAIVTMKYGARPDLARPLGDLLWRSIEPRVESWRQSARETVVVPVPLHPSRLADRGFNQSALLAARVVRRLGSSCGTRFAPRALARTRMTPQQTSLDRAARHANVAGAFRIRGPRAAAVLRDRRVLLVDDVVTTGATLDACALALVEGGAASVDRAVFAVAAQRVVNGHEGPARQNG